jgi:hypothetical protein
MADGWPSRASPHPLAIVLSGLTCRWFADSVTLAFIPRQLIFQYPPSLGPSLVVWSKRKECSL